MFKKNSILGFFLFFVVLVNNLFARKTFYSIEFKSASPFNKYLPYSKTEHNTQSLVFANFLPSELPNSENTDAEDDDLPSVLIIAENIPHRKLLALSAINNKHWTLQNTSAPLHSKLFKLYCSLKLGDSAHN